MLEGLEGAVASASFSPDGTKIVGGGDDRKVLIWDQDDHVIRRFERQAPAVSIVRYMPDGKSFVTADRYDPRVRIWDIASAKLVSSFLVPYQRGVNTLDVSPDGKWLVIGTEDKLVTVMNAANGDIRWQEYHELGDDGRTLLEQIYEFMGITEVIEDKGYLYAKGLRKVMYSSSGDEIVSLASANGVIRVWDAATGKVKHESKQRWAMADALDIDVNGDIALAQVVKAQDNSAQQDR